MPELKIRTKTTHHVDCYDFQEFVCEVYGVTGFNFAASEESGNDTSHEFTARAKSDWASYDEDDLAEFKSSNGTRNFVTHLLMDDLVRRELIPTGNYVVRVSW